MSRIESISDAILCELVTDFSARQLATPDLRRGYEGVSIQVLRDLCGAATPVDFDLALEALEKRKFIKSGPMAVYDNEPGSSWVVFGSYSKKEWVCLTVSGYQGAQKSPATPKITASAHQVSISDSTFINSPFGVGADIHQSTTLDATNDAEVFNCLLALATESSGHSAADLESDVRELVASANVGDLASGKSIFKRLFGFAASGIQQVAWGIVSTLVCAQMGIPSGPSK